MTTALKVLRYQLSDVRRSRGVLIYTLALLGLTEALLRFGGGGARSVISLLNVALILVPLVSALFGAIYIYGAREFIELLLAQPVRRRSLFLGLYGGLALPLTAGFILAVGLPFVWHGALGDGGGSALAALLAAGSLLTCSFTGVALLAALSSDDRARGLGLALGAWLGATVLYDAGVLLVVMLFGDYPLEKPLLGLMLLNPVDLARVLLLLRLDVAALMGYTGAVFTKWLGSGMGTVVAVAALLVWVAVPLGAAGWRFGRKDF